MKTKRVICLAGILACCLFFLSGFHEALGGGRRKITPQHKLSGSILSTAWYRDSLINVAVCNISNSAHSIKVATGTYDVGKHIYASQSLEVPANSIKLVYFPLLKQQTPRGDLKASDYVFVFSQDPKTYSLIGFKTIQNIYARYAQASLDSFIVPSGDRARFSYTLECDESLRIIFVAKSIKTHSNLFITGEPVEGTLRPARTEDIRELSLPVFYEKQIIKRLEGNHCFVIKRGEGATLTVVYDIGEIKDCALVTIPVYRYTFKPDGGLYAGGGHGLTFMAYDPSVVQIKTLLRLSTESKKGIYRAKE